MWQQAEIEGFGVVGVSLTREQAQETLGLRSDEVVRLRFRQYGWDSRRHPLAQVERDIIERVIDLIFRQGSAKPGVEHALGFLESKNLRLAVASSSRMVIIEAALRRLGISDRFEIVYSAEVEPLGKPNPGVYLSTARALNLHPVQCIAFEDSPVGLEAAKAAGMVCVVIPDPAADGDPRLRDADAVLPSLAELDEAMWRRLVG